MLMSFWRKSEKEKLENSGTIGKNLRNKIYFDIPNERQNDIPVSSAFVSLVVQFVFVSSSPWPGST
jgi:hypothetical protein